MSTKVGSDARALEVGGMGEAEDANVLALVSRDTRFVEVRGLGRWTPEIKFLLDVEFC